MCMLTWQYLRGCCDMHRLIHAANDLRSSKSLQLAGGVPRRPAGPPPPRPMRRYARPATQQLPRLPPPALPALPRGECSPPSFRFQVLRDGGQVQPPLLQ